MVVTGGEDCKYKVGREGGGVGQQVTGSCPASIDGRRIETPINMQTCSVLINISHARSHFPIPSRNTCCCCCTPPLHCHPCPLVCTPPQPLALSVCLSQVWDSCGRLLFQSSPLDYAVTSVAWCPSGEMFAAGSFDSLQLCDRMGWTYAKVGTKGEGGGYTAGLR